MNKLLISLLSLTGAAGISTGGYFLLKNSEEKSKDAVEGGTKVDKASDVSTGTNVPGTSEGSGSSPSVKAVST